MADDAPRRYLDRRAALAVLAGGVASVAGCARPQRRSPPQGKPLKPTDVPWSDPGITEWGERLNDHARTADIDWTQFADRDIELTIGVARHPFWVAFSAATRDETTVTDYFEELTGISVEYEVVSDEDFWRETQAALRDGAGRYDAVMCNAWHAAGYHYGSAGDPWLRDLDEYIGTASLTDRAWLAMDDFPEAAVDLLTVPDGEGDTAFVGLPNSIETFGCTALHVPTFKRLGIPTPTTIPELTEAARHISESDTVDRAGISSTTAPTALASGNWGTMFRTYGAEWFDRENKVATLDADAGVASLEQFAGLLRQYGPPYPARWGDWYASNNAYGEAQVGMLYSAPQNSVAIDDDVLAATQWLPPLPGPDGRDPVVNASVWSTAITATTDHPEAAWLYLQWAHSRQANLMLSTRQWEGDVSRAGYARLDWIAEQVRARNAPRVLGAGYLDAVEAAMAAVPSGDEHPPVPADTPQNMPIMTAAAQAMHSVISGDRTARAALEQATETVTRHVREIPDAYL